MLSHNKYKIHALCLFIIILVVINACVPSDEKSQDASKSHTQNLPSPSDSDNSEKLSKDLKNLFESLGFNETPAGNSKTESKLSEALYVFAGSMPSDDDETRALLKKWNAYLISVKDVSNNDYLNAINSQQLDYMKAIVAVNRKIELTKAYHKEYSSSWIDDLAKHFSKDFIKKNRKAIINCLYAVSVRSDNYYEDELKNLIFIEAMLYGSYEEYFGLFLDFYNEELSEDSQKKLKKRKDVATAFLAIIDTASITSMYNKSVLRAKLAENRARKQNDDLYKFLVSHSISRTLDLTKAFEDLRAAAEVH